MNEFLNLNVLFTTSIANPNRDDTGAPKQVVFGGVTRSRMSSQSMTRAKRRQFEQAAAGDQITFRAKAPGFVRYAITMAEEIATAGGTSLTATETKTIEERIGQTVDALVKKDKAIDAKKKPPTEAATATEPDSKDTAVWLAEPEIHAIAVAAVAAVRSGTPAAVPALKRTLSLSVAAFGRMFANMPELQNEAAIQRAHAYTTHGTDVELDYFIAANDLPLPDEGRGAAHLAHAQLTGGVYYWHANIDRRQLWDSWIPAGDTATVRAQLTELLWALLTALPTGKQNTSAHHTLPSAVLVGTSRQPNALHQCFEKPVVARIDGYLQPSIERMLAGQTAMNTFMPSWFGEQKVSVLGTDVPDVLGIELEPSLDETVTWCVDWLLAGRPRKVN
jgi:CRISPR system Cascade subunit CasC